MVDIGKSVNAFTRGLQAVAFGPSFSSALQKGILGPDAAHWSKDFATPAVFQPLVMKLIEMSARAQAAVDKIAMAHQAKASLGGTSVYELYASREPGPLNKEVIAYDERLQEYLRIINECIGEGRHSDPDCVYYTVTAPLLMGWFPNEAGDDVDPEQKWRKPADVGYAARMLLMAGEASSFDASQGLIKYLEFVEEAAKDRMHDLAWAAKQLAKAAGEIAAAAMEGVTKGFPWLPIAAGGLLVAYLMTRRK